MFSYGSLHMDDQRQDYQREPIYNSYVLIQDVVLKTYRMWMTIEKGGVNGSGRSVSAARLYDDDDDMYIYIDIYIFNLYIYCIIYILLYIYIYIVIHRQTVSLNIISSKWLDTGEISCWDRNLADFTTVGYFTPDYCHPNVNKEIFRCI